MTRCAQVLGVLIATVLASSAIAREAAGTLEQLEKERRRLDRDVRRKLKAQIYEIRDKLAVRAELADLRATLEAAKKALDRKEEADPNIQAAEQAVKAAREAYDKSKDDAAAVDPNVAAMKQDIEVQHDRSDEAAKAERDARKELYDVRSKVEKLPDLTGAAKALKEAEDALDDLPKTNLKIGAAYKALAEAEKAYDEARHALPEYKARSEAESTYQKAKEALPERKTRSDTPEAYAAYEKAKAAMPETKARVAASAAYEKAAKALPSYAAAQEAEKAYNELVNSDPAVQSAREERDAARKAYDQKLKALVAADPEGAVILERAKKANDDYADARKKRSEIREKLRDAERAAAKKDPKVAEARKVYEAAYSARREVIDKQTAEEQKAYRGARKAFDAKLKELLAADPKAKALLDELKTTEDRIDELYKQIRELRKAKDDERPAPAAIEIRID